MSASIELLVKYTETSPNPEHEPALYQDSSAKIELDVLYTDISARIDELVTLIEKSAITAQALLFIKIMKQ